MKIAIAQINPTIGDFKGNALKIVEFSEKALIMGCNLVVFPEMALLGYPPRDLLERSDFVDANIEALEKLVSRIKGIGVVLGFVDRKEKDLFNAAVLFEDGKIIKKAYKQLLPNYDVFDEKRYFHSGGPYSAFLYKGVSMGLTICEDIWNDKDYFQTSMYSVNPVSQLAETGASLMINISASPYNTGKEDLRKEILKNIAGTYGMNIVYANQVGGNDSLLFDGMSMAFDVSGRMLSRASDFEEDIVCVDFAAGEGEIHSVSENESSSVFKALSCGVRDYVRKCGFSKAVIGLSGGIDSAIVAAVAADALGPENVLTVFMPSEYTDKDNFEDTEKLAANLGTERRIMPIKPLFEAFLTAHGNLDPENPGITEQNLQARIRGVILMAISNKENRILLTTGNKSEMATGYCTLYGDMNGGLAVISDVFKTKVYEICNDLNKNGEIIPQRIIDKAPSAELKHDQKDQDDLPEYDLLDKILKLAVEEFKGIDEIVEAGYDRKITEDVMRRIMNNEYKRQQAPPGLRVTTKAFGLGRRFPIAHRFR
ncbi:NAD+ synthase [Desulforegula conservatrix]|uniref:NAD+ synthase n=1 Tax=Desulforegula conservatrix TaxID=153026 RepID=UPI000426264C|nr:NAD+ synthase [Desulforegula conservatrix]